MRRVLVLGLLAVLGCAGAARPLLIGITQIVDHPALNATRDGILEGLRRAGYVEGKNVQFLFANAQGDFSVAVAIAQEFRARGVDLVISITTPSSQAAVQVFKDTRVPVIFSAVTDPVGAGIAGYPNVTGASDLIDVRADVALLLKLIPGLRRLGQIYNPGEANSAILTEMTKRACAELGIELVLAAANSTAEVPLAAQALVGRVDALYCTTDNTVAAALDAVVAISKAHRIPFLFADPTSLERGVLVCTGFDYFDHGLLTAEIVVRVLQGTPPSAIPFVRQAGTQVLFNLDVAEEIGFRFPPEAKGLATVLLFGGRRFVRE
ncbi:MAG: ABC transporter substrate-binding protein [Candidatus Bipolaricaulota bacterium]|nr:ABC transporter substrate-binding protein [Candidatus Bipolaricaulota bacterium]MCX7844546.1 ABC transporter substrate-binding protein [Candidatus Bipolaricaulota bacterium]MDW8152366.1 ABC transporter substrate-binding protein [Candidatus Bipolaricaulota bacterium]